ncbi:MAG: phenylalanine--tRNA ligase subunit beta [Oscillospiraceae bacterium]|nr:phenylalanine--tRNA ligase subunit beta [Oscillospiraceae bacterium]
MNLSLNWLNDYVNTETLSVEELVSGLTMSGSKVEKAKDLSAPMNKIVIGKVVQIKKHENSDKLWICQLDIGGMGEDSLCQIVTAAQNVFEGAVVPVVLDGGTVLRDGEAFKIKKGKLRGEVSEGMLCSPYELGLSKSDLPYADDDGILILSNDLESDKLVIGGDALEFLGLKDTVVEFEITNNRPDCFSVIGLAREVSATFRLPLNMPVYDYKGADFDINSEISVKIENNRLCSRYMAGLVRNVKIAPSPRWMQSRLKAMGIRPINNIVDITNYVMLEYGNPLHAFDKRFIEGDKIIVRSAENGEKITLLDGNTITLDESVLVIADAVKPVAVAGVMGGEYSGVMDDTNTVVFEAACFEGVSVRRAAKKIGRRTESSSRFEKGLNPQNVEIALERALQLVEELGIGEVASKVIDISCFEPVTVRVPHDYAGINAFLGTNIPEVEQIDIFARLGFGYDSANKCVIAPLWRSDVKSFYDLSEEVARIYGYDEIPPTVPKMLRSSRVDGYEHDIGKLAEVMTAQGCSECVTYSFVSQKMADENAVKIRNPFGEETSVMRTSLIPSMLKVVADNLNAGNGAARLFEIGRVYSHEKETDVLCVGIFGKEESFYTLKGIFEELFASFRIGVSVNRYTEMPFHPGRAAFCDYAKLGEISPLLLREYGINPESRVYAFEIDLAVFFAESCRKITHKPIQRYPASVRDLSLVCDDDFASGRVVELIEKAGAKHLESVEFFDVFKGGNLGEGVKSLSYKLTFRKADGTLTDAEVDKAVTKTLSVLEENNIKLRS